MTEYVTITIPSSLRADFVDEYGYDRLVTNLGQEKAGLRDAWNAIEFAAPKGQSSMTVRIHHRLLPVLREMLEVRWADHFQRMTDLEAPYARAVDQLKKIILTRKKAK